MIVAIHQPNYFPWLGYFDKIRKSDIFVFMDDVAYPKSGSGSGSWCNRVKILIQGKPAWITCPIVRESGVQLIRNVKIDDRQAWKRKILKTIEYNYKKTPYFEENWDWVKSMFLYETDSLAAFNIHNIKQIMEKLSYDASFVLQSILQTREKATGLLIEITKKIGGDAYLCGNGASGYQDDAEFDRKGIKLVYQNFKDNDYPQIGIDFSPGLSILDAFFNCGYKMITKWMNVKSK